MATSINFDAVVIKPNGGITRIRNITIDQSWQSRYQWLYGFWPDDDRFIRYERTEES